MKTIISAAALAISLSTAALAQQPAPTTAGPAEIFTRLPAGTTVPISTSRMFTIRRTTRSATSMTF